MNNKRTIEIGFWLVVFTASFIFHSQVVVWYKALFFALKTILLYAAIAYFNIKFLIPNFFNRPGYVWYLLNVVLIYFLAIYLLAHTDLLVSFDANVELIIHDSGLEKVIARNTVEVKTFISFLMISLVILSSLAYKVTLNYLEKQQNQIVLEREKTRAEVNYLKAQMSPHFFLNALNGLYALARISPEKTAEYITKLSDMLRYLTYNGNKEVVPLVSEIDHIKNFIYFQQYKDDTIQVEWQELIEDGQFHIEPMLLIPFVENAFKHSIINEGSVHISIRIQLQENELLFECNNTLPREVAISADPNYSGIGIENVKKRLQARYKDNFILMHHEENGVYKVVLKINNFE